MYNKERKQEYLRHMVEDLGRTSQSSSALFNKTEDYEKLFNKDFSLINKCIKKKYKCFTEIY